MVFGVSGAAIAGALVTGAASAVGSYAVGQMIGGGSSGGSSGGGGGSAAQQAADPFAAQRPQYQGQLNSFMGTSPQQYDSASLASGPASYQNPILPGQTTGGQMMQDMLSPGYQFNSSDPSYAFRMQQGAGALASSGAAKGMLNSGNIATALTDYGQNMASTEYQAQFQRAQAQDNGANRLQQQNFTDTQTINSFNQSNTQQAFNNYNTLNNNNQTNYGNQFSRLAQLAGANIGSPAAASQAAGQQSANASAGAHQIIDPITGLIKTAFGSGNSSTDSNPAGGNGANNWNPYNVDAPTYNDNSSFWASGG